MNWVGTGSEYHQWASRTFCASMRWIPVRTSHISCLFAILGIQCKMYRIRFQRTKSSVKYQYLFCVVLFVVDAGLLHEGGDRPRELGRCLPRVDIAVPRASRCRARQGVAVQVYAASHIQSARLCRYACVAFTSSECVAALFPV